jgi:hypothetical protein
MHCGPHPADVLAARIRIQLASYKGVASHRGTEEWLDIAYQWESGDYSTGPRSLWGLTGVWARIGSSDDPRRVWDHHVEKVARDEFARLGIDFPFDEPKQEETDEPSAPPSLADWARQPCGTVNEGGIR